MFLQHRYNDDRNTIHRICFDMYEVMTRVFALHVSMESLKDDQADPSKPQAEPCSEDLKILEKYASN